MRSGRLVAVATLAAAVAVVLARPSAFDLLTRRLPASPAREASPASDDEFYGHVSARAHTWPEFLSAVVAQRELWLRNAREAEASPVLTARLAAAGSGLEFLVVAEDWCTDSVNTLPFIARLAEAAHVPLQIVDRSAGWQVMERHRTADGRAVTPTVVLLRHRRDVGAWVERPVVLQQLFRAMASDESMRRQFEQRQAWYEADRGRTTLRELVAQVEAVR